MINRLGAVLLAGTAVAGFWLEQPLLALAGLLGLAMGGAQLLWARHCLTGLEYERSLSSHRAFWGERLTLTVRIVNRKLLPLTWVLAEDRLPNHLAVERERPNRAPERQLDQVRSLVAMLPYEQVLRRYTVLCRQRGRYEFGPASLESGDLMGYQSRIRHFRGVEELLVYPKLVELDLDPPRARRIIGRHAVDRVILTDPSRTVGVRRYERGDPMRHVDWRASARSRDLMVRLFEPSTDLSIATFLDLRVARGPHGAEPLEMSISLAASLARWAIGHRFRVGLYANGILGRAEGVRVPISDGPDQLRTIMESLALAHPAGWRPVPISTVLLSESRTLPQEASVLLVVSEIDDILLAALDEVRRRRPVTLVHVRTGTAVVPRLSGVDLLTVEFDENWQQLERIRLAA